MTLYEISQEYQNALDRIVIDEETGEILHLEDLDDLKGVFEDKAEAIALYIKDLESTADAIENEKKALETRFKSKRNKADRLRRYLSDMMINIGNPGFETTRCKLGFRKSTQVNILDEALIPSKYITQEISTKIDKTAIKTAIKLGETVRGAEVVEHQNLQIK